MLDKMVQIKRENIGCWSQENAFIWMGSLYNPFRGQKLRGSIFRE